MTENKKCIGFDLHGTLVDEVKLMLPKYNKKYSQNLKYEDIKTYEIQKYLVPECTNFFDEFFDDDLLNNMTLKDGVLDILNYCQERFILRIVTAAFPWQFGDYYFFIKERFKSLKEHQFVRIQEDKQCYKMDVLFDDYEGNLIGGNYIKCLVSQPWNANITKGIDFDIRVNDWNDKEVWKFLERL